MVALQLVTVGPRVSEVTAELFAANAYRDYLELHGLSVQLTEALAEYWHARVRAELGLRRRGPDDMDGMLPTRATAAPGSRSATRPAPTWRTAPSSSSCCEPERIGVELSEEFQLHPEQSTDALVVHHPEAKYFNAK